MGVTDAELLAEIRRLADDIGATPTLQQMRDHGQYSVTTYYNHFDSWSAAVEAAGFEPHQQDTKHETEDLLAELRRLASELGAVPTAAQMNAEGKFWANSYQNHFGSWRAALEAADLEPRDPDTRIDPSALIEDLQRVADAVDGSPSEADVREHGEYGVRTFYRRFGSWGNALEAAELGDDAFQERIPIRELLVEVQRLEAALGRPPSTVDVRERGRFSLAPYYRRFGSWEQVLEAAGIDPGDD